MDNLPLMTEHLLLTQNHCLIFCETSNFRLPLCRRWITSGYDPGRNFFIFSVPIHTASRSIVMQINCMTSLPAGGIALRRPDRLRQIFRRLWRRQAFRRLTTSGYDPGRNFFYFFSKTVKTSKWAVRGNISSICTLLT